MNPINKTKVVTGTVRLSYANVWEPKSINGGKEKYSVSLIIPKSDTKTLEAINTAIDAAITEGISKFGGKKPNKASLKLPPAGW
jgi:ABC-type Na+ efflux pump permease subunit